MRSGRRGHRTWRRPIWRRMARTVVKPSLEDSRGAYEARSLKMWWTPDRSMLHLHGEFPDVMGEKVEATIKRLSEQRKPAKGRAWERFEHRAADAMFGMCDAVAVAERVETPTLAPPPVLVVQVPPRRAGRDRRDPDRR